MVFYGCIVSFFIIGFVLTGEICFFNLLVIFKSVGMAEVVNKKLYNYVKTLANKKFQSKSGIYRSSWIVKEYKRRGGKYMGSKPKKTGLTRWFKEKWVDLNRPIKNSSGKIIGYKSCGRQSVNKSGTMSQGYPLCRPTYRITSKTPRTYKQINKQSIAKAKKQKSKTKGRKNIQFAGCGDPSCATGNMTGGCDSGLCMTGGCDSMTGRCDSMTGGFINNFISKHYNKSDDKKEQEGSGKIRSQYYGKRSSIVVKVPVNVKKWAQYAFKLKKIGFKGATNTGWLRAKQLANKDYIPIQDFRYMRNWYARHRYTSYPGYKQWIDNGKPKDNYWKNKRSIMAWVTWGGNPGFKWVNSTKAINLLNKNFNKNYKKIKTLN